MTRQIFRTGICLLWLPVALCACSSRSPTSHGTDTGIAVGTAAPVRRLFHDHVIAWGHVAAAPHATRTMALPYGVRVVALDVIAGQAVKRGQPLLTVAPDPAAQRAYAQAANALTLARKQLAQTRQLASQHLATQSQLDAAQKTLSDAQTTLQTLKTHGGSKAKVTLKAPADGVVGTLHASTGQQVAADAPLVVFLPTHAMVASINVLPEDATRLHTGQSVHLRTAYDNHTTWKGTLTVLGHAVNPQTHMVHAIAALSGHPPLADGTSLSATIDTSSFTAWAVPRDALQSDAQGSYIFQIEHGKAKRVDVKVLAPDGSPIGISGKIDPHAPVITLGSYETANGDPVHVKSSPAAPAKGTAKR